MPERAARLPNDATAAAHAARCPQRRTHAGCRRRRRRRRRARRPPRRALARLHAPLRCPARSCWPQPAAAPPPPSACPPASAETFRKCTSAGLRQRVSTRMLAAQRCPLVLAIVCSQHRHKGCYRNLWCAAFFVACNLTVLVAGCYAQVLRMCSRALQCMHVPSSRKTQEKSRMPHLGVRKDQLLIVLRQARHRIHLVFADGQQVLRCAAEAGPPASRHVVIQWRRFMWRSERALFSKRRAWLHKCMQHAI